MRGSSRRLKFLSSKKLGADSTLELICAKGQSKAVAEDNHSPQSVQSTPKTYRIKEITIQTRKRCMFWPRRWAVANPAQFVTRQATFCNVAL